MVYRIVFIIAFSVLLLLSYGTQAAVWNIVYPRAVNDQDVFSKYPVQLLTLALDHTGVKYKLVPSDRIMLQRRVLRRLKESRDVNVVWSGTDTDREQELLPIRIPITKGLIGWRLFLIRNDSQSRFNDVTTLSQLLRLSPIQGISWPDTTVLRANGFTVTTSPNDNELHQQLRYNRGDFFPRSVLEIWDELNNPEKSEGLLLEPKLAIRYPAALYFFVNKSDKTLARLLNDGLEKAIADGSFDRLFNQTFASYLADANIADRQIFRLENPLLTPETPLDRPELWYNPQSDTSEGEIDLPHPISAP